jgi:hypothetical protein
MFIKQFELGEEQDEFAKTNEPSIRPFSCSVYYRTHITGEINQTR